VQGIIDFGTAKAFAEYGLRIDGVSLRLTLPDGTTHAFQGPPGSADLTGTSGSADGDAIEQGVPTPHSLHITGDARCGTPVG
jgi:hypothetical protein